MRRTSVGRPGSPHADRAQWIAGFGQERRRGCAGAAARGAGAVRGSDRGGDLACCISPSFQTGVAAYEVAAALATEQLQLGHDVVVDAVNALEVVRTMWRRVATRAGVEMSVIEVVCSDPAVHRRRLGSRVRDIDGFPEPTWDEVSERQMGWDEWTDRRLVLDSLEPLDANVERALRHVGTKPP